MEERKRRAKNRRFFFVVGADKQQGCLKLAKRKSPGRKPVVVCNTLQDAPGGSLMMNVNPAARKLCVLFVSNGQN